MHCLQPDILIAIMPKIDPYGPTTGPAGLKSYIAQYGYTSKIIDLNIDLYNWLDEDKKERYWNTSEDLIFSANESDFIISDEQQAFLDECNPWFDNVLEIIKQENPKYLGLSLLTFYSTLFSLKLSQLVKQHCPNIKIIWGGGAINRQTQKVYDRKIIDYWIYGDGEKALINLLQGNIHAKGINQKDPDQYDNLNELPVPDYSDIDFSKYKIHDEALKLVYITGSRGCVKKCTFCDVHLIWPKYKFRSAEHVFNEIKTLHQNHGFNDFNFTDSLINGSMKNFRELLHMIKEYKHSGNPDIGWHSQWIMRSPTQCTEDDYILMQQSGCRSLDVGLESFSESVRFHMGKKIKDEDMWFCLEMLQKYKIVHSLLMIVGYPTETEEDHLLALERLEILNSKGWIDAIDKHGCHLMHFGWGNTLMLDYNSAIYKQIENDLEYYNSVLDWKYKDNDLATRKRRMKEIWDYINNKRGKNKLLSKLLETHFDKSKK